MERGTVYPSSDSASVVFQPRLIDAGVTDEMARRVAGW
jgi:hypothetical protein